MHPANRGKKLSKNIAAEMFYNIDGKHFVRTLHERQGKDYAGTPSAAELKLGSKHIITVVEVEDDDNYNESFILSVMSRSNLIALPREKATILSDSKDSAPKCVAHPAKIAIYNGESSSNSSDESAKSDWLARSG